MRGDKIKIPKKEVRISTGIHNRFDVEVIDTKTGKIRQRAYGENVILDQAWPYITGVSNAERGWSSYIQYGSGTGTPANTDTQLFSFLGSVVVDTEFTNNFDHNHNVYSVTRKATIDETVAVGKTISEIGVARNLSATALCTHAMLHDMNGNPISIIKTDHDIINFYATIYIHLVLPDYARYGGLFYENVNASTPVGYSILDSISGVVPITSSIANYYMILSDGYWDLRKNDFTPIVNRISGNKATRYSNSRSFTYKFPRIPVSKWNDVKNVKNVYIYRGSTGNSSVSQYPYPISHISPTPDFIFEVGIGGWCYQPRILNETIGTGDGIATDFCTKFKVSGNATVKIDGNTSYNVTVGMDFIGEQEFIRYFKLIRCEKTHIETSIPPASQYAYGYWYYTYPGVPGEAAIFENTLYERVGILSVKHAGASTIVDIYCSNDLENWEHFQNDVPLSYQNYRYWSFSSDSKAQYTVTPNASLPSSNNIHFSSPPPAGAVITADYDTDVIAKDENHVFDFSVTFDLGEYTEE